MFAYCGNSPIKRIDYSGMFWEEIGEFFVNAWEGIKDWASDTFGARSSTTVTIEDKETQVVADPSPVTVTTGAKTTQTVSSRGDSSKPISVFANKDAQHPIISSSVGININISDFTLVFSLGLDNTSISGAIKSGDRTDSFGVKADFSEFQVGFESATTIQQGNTSGVAYSNISANFWAIAAAYCLITTGQSVPSPSFAG